MVKKANSAPIEELLLRVKADRSNLVGAGTPEGEIEQLEKKLAVNLPESYKTFLRTFDGGQFNFGRLHCISENGAGWHDLMQQLDNFFSYHPILGVRGLLPFASSYGGDVYCFKLNEMQNGECPVVEFDHEGADDQELTPVGKNLTDWIQKCYEEYASEEFSIEIYISTNADLADLNLLDDKHSLFITTPDEAEFAVRVFLTEGRTYKYQIFGEQSWEGSSKEKDPSKFKDNIKSLESLDLYISEILKTTNEPLELFIFSSGEMSTNEKWKTTIGKTKLMGNEIELTAGDLLKISPDGQITKLALPSLPNHVEKPKAGGELCCSFCSQPSTAVQKLISGPSVTICDQCVELCNNILDDEFEETSDETLDD